MKNTSTTNATLNKSSGLSTVFPFKGEGIAWGSVFILISVLIVVGNSLTISVFAVNKRLRKKSLLLVINMAFTDLMSGAVSVPIYVYDVAVHFQIWRGPWDINKPLSNFVDTTFMQASLISATLIASERFFATYQPLKHRTLPRHVYHIVIFTVWILALHASAGFVAASYFVSGKYALCAWTPYVLTLKSIVCGCNIAVWRKFRQKNMASRREIRALQNQRLTKTLLFVSILAILCCFPLGILKFLTVVNHATIPARLYGMANVLNYSNCFLNPLVYAFRIPGFRKRLRLVFYRQQTATDTKRNSMAVVLKQAKGLTTNQQSDPGHQQLAFKQQIMDTKL